jgi:hypothetical protein
MTDITLVPITGAANLSAINNNFAKVQESVNNDVLNLAGGNNTMNQDIDMNGNDLLNLNTDVNNPSGLITLGQADARYYNVAGDTLTGGMNAAGQHIINLPVPSVGTEPMRKAEFDAYIAGQDVRDDAQDAAALVTKNQTVRAPDGETIPALSVAAGRADKLMSFDSFGNPVAIAAANQSATDLELRLANSTDPSKGATLVGYQDGTVADKLAEIVSGAVTEPLVDAKIAEHNGDAGAHPAFSAFITSEADRAEAAASMAAAFSKPFPTTTDGLDNTSGSGATNRFFSVPVAGSTTLATAYRNDAGVAVNLGQAPSVLAIDAINAKIPSIAPIGYAWSVFDGLLRAAIGVKDDGTFSALLAEIAELRATILKVAGHSLSSKTYAGFKWVVDDALDKAAIGVMDDGTLVSKRAIITDLQVERINGLPYSPSVLSRLGGVYSHQINFINNSGQSLSEGSTPATALTTTQEYDSVGFPAHATSPAGFVPLTVANTQVGTRGESPMYGTLGHIKELIAEENGIGYAANDYQLVACNNGYSGFSILSLNKGTAPYTAAMSQVQSAFNIAQAAGKSMAFQATTWTQGEADSAMTKDTYKGHIKQLAVDYNTDGKAITGQFNNVKLIVYQCATTISNRNIALAQLEASNESPLIFMACPMYQFDYGDNQHINAQSSKWLGGYYGLAYKRLIVDREDWKPLQPVGHSINGNTLDLIFNKTGLVLDTSLIPAQVNSGFQVLDAASGVVAITAISVIGPNRVRLTLASTPAPGWFVGYGLNSAVGKSPFVGGCGNLRDSQGDTMIYSAINKPMHNWCVIFNYSL